MENNINPMDEQQKFVNMMPDYSIDADQQNEELRIGFGRRFGALLIDGIITSILIFIVVFATGTLEDILSVPWNEVFSKPMMAQEVFGNIGAKVGLFSGIISLLYFSMEIFISASLGKMMLGIKIARANRTPASMVELVNRYAMKHSSTILTLIYSVTMINAINILSSFVGFAVFVAYFFVFSASKQTLYDKLAKTAVYYNDEIIND